MEDNRQTKKTRPLQWLLLVISGLLIGGGAILPGVSGGVLCVVFGLYRPMMEMLSHPLRAFPQYWRILVPVAIGGVLGFLGFARVIDIVFSANELLATWLFIGLIAGTLPALYREAGLQGRPRSGYISFGVAFTGLLALLALVRFSPATHVSPSFLWYAFAGVLWGLSIIVPGMTSSSILMSLDLYQPLASGIAEMDVAVLLPWILGMAVTVLALAKLVNHLFNRHYAHAYHAVLGVVLASTLAILPIEYGSVRAVLLSLLCFGAGFAVAWLLARLDKRGAQPAMEAAGA